MALENLWKAWLGEEEIRARLQCAPLDRLVGVAREQDHSTAPGAGICLDPPDGRDAVDLRHGEIHHYHIGCVVESSLDGSEAIAGGDHRESTTAEVFRIEIADVDGVIRDQDDGWTSRGSSSTRSRGNSVFRCALDVACRLAVLMTSGRGHARGMLKWSSSGSIPTPPICSPSTTRPSCEPVE